MHTQEEYYASTVVSHQFKYKGLLKRSVFKNYRDQCFRFFDYLYTMASSHEKAAQFMRILHYIQIFIISLCPLSLTFWPRGSVLGKIINVLSVFGLLCPPQSSELAHITIAFAVYSILLLFLIFLFINVSIFHKYTKINQHIINFICITLSTLLPFFILYIGSNIGREISVITRYHSKDETEEFKSNCYFKFQIACLCIGLFLSILLFTIQLLFVTPVLTFRPQSLHFLNSLSILIYLGSYFIISVLSSAAGGLNNYAVLFATLIPLLFLHFLTYFEYEAWGTFEFREVTLSVLESIFVLLLVEYLFLIFHVKMNEILLFAIVILFILLNTIYPKYYIRIRRQYLALCDRLLASPNLFEKLTERQAILILRIGFEMGHPLCHNWEAFEYADSKFPNDRRILLLILRYATIYPDESIILRIVISKVQAIKKHDIELKFLLFQLHSLCQQRERGLSKSLKKTLSHIDSKTDKCRNQIKLVWNNVIQGNISEIEDLSMQLKKNTEEITREYNQLCTSYPNNPYVASAFGAFLSDIWCKEKEAMTFKRIYRLLRNGGKTRVERTYYFARNLFQNLPNDRQHNQMKARDDEDEKNANSSNFSLGKSRNNNDNSLVSMSVDNLCDLSEDLTDEKSQQKHLETMIESVHLPSLRYGPILIFSTISLLFPLISLFFSIFVYNIMKTNVKGIQLFEKECLQQAIVGHISIVYYYHVMNSNRLMTAFSDILSLSISSFNYLLSLANYDEDLLNGINEVFPELFSTGYFEESLNFLFNDSITFNKVYSNYSLGMTTRSYEFFITRVSESVLRAAPMRASKLLNMSDFWTIIYSYPDLLKKLNQFSEIQKNEMYSLIKGNYLKTFATVMSIGLSALIVFIAITALVFKKMSIEKESLFMSFKSLPKSAISATISKLNAQLGRHEDDGVQISLSTQEERALRLLTINQNNTIARNLDNHVLVILLLFIICVCSNLFFLVRSQKIIINALPNMCSIMFSASNVHSTFAAIILNIIRIVTHDHRQLPFNSLQTKDDLINMTASLFDSLDIQIHNLVYHNIYDNSGLKSLYGTGSTYIDFFTRTPNITVENLSDNETYLLSFFSIENSISYTNFLLNELFEQINTVTLNHDTFTLSIQWLFNTSFPNIVMNIISSSVESASTLHKYVRNYFLIVPLLILNFAIFCCGLALIPRFIKNAETAKWTLRLLLFCPPTVVMQSRPIIKILSNDFSKEVNEDNQEKIFVYEKIVSQIKGAAIFLDNEFIVRSTNIAFDEMFGIDKIGTSLFDLFTSPPGQESHLFSFKEKLQDIQMSKISPNIEGDFTVMVKSEENSEKMKSKKIHFSLIGININGHVQKKSVISDGISFYSLVLEDMTKAIELKNKLSDEKAKINHLLNLTLPEKVVIQKVNNNSDQFFKVQNASFVSIDFLNIQRLFSKNSPSDILLTLGKIIDALDHSLKSSFPQLVRINSFGDTFFTVGGIFKENEQSQEHARQSALFAVDSISIVNGFNRSNRNFDRDGWQVKVGVCSGGPVAAGLIDLAVPTFSVVGSPVALAVELEKGCTPMCAQMTKSVFELAFDGDTLLNKEPSQIMFEDRLVETYIVS